MKIAYQIFHVDTGTQSSADRRELMKTAKKQLDLNFEELGSKSIYLNTPESVKEYFGNKPYPVGAGGYANRGWKLGELGVWASNIEALETFLASDYDAVILMEDDIVLSKGFNARLIRMLRRLPDQWDLFSGFVPLTAMRKFRINPRKYRLPAENEIGKLFQTWSMLCYVVTKPGAEKILNLLKKGINVPIDTLLYTENIGLNAYSILYAAENLCSLGHSLPSTIQDAEFLDLSAYVN